jgi:hypothetical protein
MQVQAPLTSKFINILYQFSDHAEKEHVRSNQILCEFLSLIGSVVLARAADDLESSAGSSSIWSEARINQRRFAIIPSPDANRGVSKTSFRHSCLRPAFPLDK